MVPENYYEVWDRLSGNLLGDYDSLEDVLANWTDSIDDPDMVIFHVDGETGEVINEYNMRGQVK